jgi:hypothetical protein
MIKIDKNIPLPQRNLKGGKGSNKAKYPFKNMQVGDSFLLKTLDTKAERHYQRVLMIGAFKDRLDMKGKKIATRSVPGGIRCWRTE